MSRDDDALRTAFLNRMAKNMRHWGKWARRQGIECFRVYDRDLPEFPLLIDRYGEHLHVQEVDTAWEQSEAEHAAWAEFVREACATASGLEPRHVHFKLRRKQAHREAGGQYEKLGEGEGIRVQESGLNFWVNLDAYLDTGLFLDHRLTRAMVRERSAGKRLLNLFGYTGSFTVYAAAGGAAASETIDLSNTYLDWAGRNLAANRFDARRHRLTRADVFTWLREAESEGRRFDLAVLDPPSFSHSKKMAGVLDIQRDHVWLIRQALRLLSPGGQLFFSTNRRDFVLDEGIVAHKGCREITEQTVPEDFRRRRPHRAWLIETRNS